MKNLNDIIILLDLIDLKQASRKIFVYEETVGG